MNDSYFDEAIEFDNLCKALKKCCRNVRWKDSVVGYEANGLKNTLKLQEDLQTGKYKISPYQQFTIYEPKVRTIIATRLRDRQVQKALCDKGLYDDMTEHLIHDNGACQTGKGTDYTFNRLTALLRRYNLKHGVEGWVLKCDIKKFFPSTPHSVAKEAVCKRIKDERACKMVCDVIDSFDGEVGIGLGSQISQLVELCVLDDLDHYIKEQLGIKYYIRYMDDFVLIHPNKYFLQDCRDIIERRLGAKQLNLNKKTTLYPLSQGVKLMNWRFVILPSGKIARFMAGKKQGKQRRKMAKLMAKEKAGLIEQGTTYNSFIAWRANAKRGETFYQRQRMETYYYELLKGEKNHEQQLRSETVPGGSNCQSAQG